MDGKVPLATGEDDNAKVLDLDKNLTRLPRRKQTELSQLRRR